MKRAGNRKAKRLLWTGIPVLLIVLLLAVCFFYLGDYYHADGNAVAAFHAGREMEERTLSGGDIAFVPDSAETGLIFYPGAKVDHIAYVPLMRALSSEGVLCVLCRMPLRLALLDLHDADGAREAFPEIGQWYIAGHSLGGVVASMELKNHPDDYEGLILLGSYSNEDLRDESVRVLMIRGSEDRVLDRDKYEAAKAGLPADSTEIVIEGGCHAYFGMYGPQDGDGTPTVSNEEQIWFTVKAVSDWIGKGGADAENP